MRRKAEIRRNAPIISKESSQIGFRSHLRPRTLVFFAILIAMIVIMGVLAVYDYQWTIWLNHHRVEWLDEFMGRTIFEGEGFGGGDAAVLFMAAALCFYIFAWVNPGHKRLEQWRPYLGFITSAGFICGLFMVHSLKWVMGRARPGLVFTGGLAYSEWYRFGPHFVTEGIYRGSFPSGHTAAVLLFLTPAYIFLASPDQSRPRRAAGLIWGFLSLSYSVLMAIARTMTLSHWLSDCVFSIFFGWVIIHILYFWVLRVPDQDTHYRHQGILITTPKFWELRLCLLLSPVILGGMAMVIGGRSLYEYSVPWLGVLIPAGVFTGIFFWKRLHGLHKRVFGRYGEG